MVMFNFKTSSSSGTGRDHNHSGFIFGIHLVVILIIVFSSMFTSVDSSFEQVKVTVINNITGNPFMRIQCRTDGEVLDDHPSVAYGESISWDFQVDALNTTKYCCVIQYNDPNDGHLIHGDFSIYEAEKDLPDCGGNCSRFVQEKGIFFHPTDANATLTWPNPEAPSVRCPFRPAPPPPSAPLELVGVSTKW
ncbi:Plant self-incompatibility S1 [Macleaya cordata]|uniref:Plant self-incompatibility S1 n=1 Tax=Macleaya cordata TaxID=56857 RepID=A0A200PZU6_MACCD|nr:Plant self-incompatibility S1 [Macleaya cordata]